MPSTPNSPLSDSSPLHELRGCEGGGLRAMGADRVQHPDQTKCSVDPGLPSLWALAQAILPLGLQVSPQVSANVSLPPGSLPWFPQTLNLACSWLCVTARS